MRSAVSCFLLIVVAFVSVAVIGASEASAFDRFVNRSVVVNRGFGGGFNNRAVVVNRGFGGGFGVGFGVGFGSPVIVNRGFGGFGGPVVIDRGFGGFGNRAVIIDRGGFGGCGSGRSVIVDPGFNRSIFRSSSTFRF